MRTEIAEQGGWIVISLYGDASNASHDRWAALRAGIPWERGACIICDLTGMTGASDRMVETLLGIAADAHHRGGGCVLVGVKDELYARMGAMQVAHYMVMADTIEEARMHGEWFPRK